MGSMSPPRVEVLRMLINRALRRQHIFASVLIYPYNTAIKNLLITQRHAGFAQFQATFFVGGTTDKRLG